MGWRLVLGQSVASYDQQIHVTIRDDESGAEQTIVSNRIHPYFVQRLGPRVEPAIASEELVYRGPIPGGSWVDAGELEAGDRLLNPDGSWATVLSRRAVEDTLQAWNLTVEGYHSYFVAEDEADAAVWVHNDCLRIVNSGMPDATKRAVERAGFETRRGAARELKRLGAEIEAGGWPDGTVSLLGDKHVGRTYVPFGTGRAVYQETRSGRGTFRLKTVVPEEYVQ